MDLINSIKFDRNEFAGSFGDIGTTLQLIIGMILVTDLQASAVFTLFWVMLIFTRLNYGIPMPVQPLKAVAIIVITSNIHTEMIYTAGFIIGVVMILLSISGLLTKFGNLIPVPVIRGIQLGLGLKIASLALGSYLSIDSFSNFFLTATAFLVTLTLLGNRKIPPALILILLGVIYAVIFEINQSIIFHGVGFTLPTLNILDFTNSFDIIMILVIPQLALSLPNSIFATKQTIQDLYPDNNPELKKLETLMD